jgi:uncharacterized oligopeptide transporter (OPT) family protein
MEVSLAATEIEKCEAGGGDVESEPAPAAAAREERVPPWREQLTARGLVAALLIGFVYTVIILKLALTTGIIPTLNVSAALLAFLALRGWTRVLGRLGVASRPFTRQENTVVQTCAVACYTMGFGGTLPSTTLFIVPAESFLITSWPSTSERGRGILYAQVGSGRRCWLWTRRRTSSPE